MLSLSFDVTDAKIVLRHVRILYLSIISAHVAKLLTRLFVYILLFYFLAAIDFTSATATVLESAGNITLTVTNSGPTDGTVGKLHHLRTLGFAQIVFELFIQQNLHVVILL